MQSLLAQIDGCNDCVKFGSYNQALTFQPKACVSFHSYRFCNFGKVKNLFIAEAPPYRQPRYFYNTQIAPGNLRKGLFKQLKIGDNSDKGLNIFSEENFLIDTVKCRIKKDKSKLPMAVINNCAKRFLQEEIELIHPTNIVLLGNTARCGLGGISDYSALKSFRVKKDCGKIITIGDYKVVLYAYPSIRNLSITKSHPLLELLQRLENE